MNFWDTILVFVEILYLVVWLLSKNNDRVREGGISFYSLDMPKEEEGNEE